MKILISGARSYVAYSLLKLANLQNLEVIISDSQEKNICFQSGLFDSKFIFPSPKNNFFQFKNKIIDFCKSEKIEYIFPTCEEVFYFSQIKTDLEKIGTKVFCDKMENLIILHSKFDFINFCHDLAIKTPKTDKIENISELEKYKNCNEKYIFKYEFSRFASNIFINFDNKNFKNISLLKNLEGNLVAQEFIDGKKFCSFGIAKNGKLYSNIIYDVKMSYKGGSATFFGNIFDEKIHNFVRQIVKKMNFHGFISFDYIIGENGIFVIECNPRMTSGIHLFDEEKVLSEIIFKNSNQDFFPKKEKIKTFLLPNLCFNFLKSIKKPGSLSFQNDVFSKSKKLFFYQVFLLFYYFYKAKISRKTLSEATTGDIEFNP